MPLPEAQRLQADVLLATREHALFDLNCSADGFDGELGDLPWLMVARIGLSRRRVILDTLRAVFDTVIPPRRRIAPGPGDSDGRHGWARPLVRSLGGPGGGYRALPRSRRGRPV